MTSATVHMGFDTLDQYRLESETERGGWRGLLGTILTFAGFVVLANAFVIALLFRQILTFRYQLLFAALGGMVGVVGMWLRGNNRAQMQTATAATVAAIIAMTFVALVDQRFGLPGRLVLTAAIFWVVKKLEEHAWKKL